jgi:site-specific DNA-adenine methylase
MDRTVRIELANQLNEQFSRLNVNPDCHPMSGLVAWGSYLTGGVYLQPPSQDFTLDLVDPQAAIAALKSLPARQWTAQDWTGNIPLNVVLGAIAQWIQHPKRPMQTITPVKPIIGRVGGKARLAPWILSHLTRSPWSIWCEPFAGSAAVYFRLINDGIPDRVKARGHHFRAVLNDADSRIVQLFRTCRDYPELLAYAVAMTPYSREAQRGLCGIDDEIEQARRFLVDGWQSFKKMHGDSWGIEQNYHDGKSSTAVWHTLPDRVLNATDHFKRCYIENDDAIAVMERWATPHTCFYCDPPYVNCEDYYAHNKAAGKADSLELHYRLAEAANTVEAATVAISYYPNDLLDKLYPEADWERHYKETVASSAGITRQSKTRTRPKRTELLLIRKNRNRDRTIIDMGGQLSLL